MDDSQTVKGETPALADVVGPPSPAVNMHVSVDASIGMVKLDFDQNTRSVSMAPDACRALAKTLRTMANEVERAGRQGARGRLPRNAMRTGYGGDRW